MDAHAPSFAPHELQHMPQRSYVHAYAQPVPQMAPLTQPTNGYVPVAPQVAQQLATTPHAARAPEPLRDPRSWTLVKHSALVAFVLMAVMVALQGEGDLALSAAYAMSAMLSIGTFVVADRVRFLDRHGLPEAMQAATAEGETAFRPLAGYDPVPVVPATTWRPAAPAVQPAVHVTAHHDGAAPFRISVT